jgi:hypothetical protein
MKEWLPVLLVALGLQGCQLPVDDQEQEKSIQYSAEQDAIMRALLIEKAQQEEAARVEERRQREINYLLLMAEQALSDDRLMQPSSDNAYDWYQQVLALDGANAKAHNGMRQITVRYVELAQRYYDQGMYVRAHQMLDGAGRVSASPGVVEALKRQYKLPPPKDNEFYLSVNALAERGESIGDELMEITHRAVEAQSRLLIVARNDEEGRWIYRQMRSFTQDYRLRGNIQLGERPKIVLLDLET